MCCSLQVVKLDPAGNLPTVRGYHSFHTMGQRCYVVGGRTTSELLLMGDQFVGVYDAATNQWVESVLGSNPSPTPRSSHRGIALSSNQILICGGTGRHKKRLRDTQVLRLGSNGVLTWSHTCVPSLGSGKPNKLHMLQLSRHICACQYSSTAQFCGYDIRRTGT